MPADNCPLTTDRRQAAAASDSRYPAPLHPEADLNFYCPLRFDGQLGRVVVLEGRAVHDQAPVLVPRGWCWRSVNGQGTGSRQPACLVIEAAYLNRPVTQPQRDRLELAYFANTSGASRERLLELQQLVKQHDREDLLLQSRNRRQREEQRAREHREHKSRQAYRQESIRKMPDSLAVLMGEAGGRP